MTEHERSTSGFARNLGRDAARGLAAFVLGIVAIAAGLATFLGLGTLTGIWSPSLGLFALAAVSAAGFLWWRRPRHLVATVVAAGGALAGLALGASEGLGLQIVIGAAGIAVVALFWTLVEIFAS